MTHRNNAPRVAPRPAPIARGAGAERAKRLQLDEHRVKAALCVAARAATGKTQEQLALDLGTTRETVKCHEDATRDHAPTLRMLSRSSDAYLDALLANLARSRAEHGFAKRVWTAAASVEHTCDEHRSRVIVHELTDVIRVRACATHDHAAAVREIDEAIAALQEARAHHEGKR